MSHDDEREVPHEADELRTETRRSERAGEAHSLSCRCLGCDIDRFEREGDEPLPRRYRL